MSNYIQPQVNFLQDLIRRDDWDDVLRLKRGAYLKSKGTTDTHVYYIRSGSMKICIEDGSTEHILRFAYDDNLFAILDSYFSEQPSGIYVQTIKQSEVCVLSKARFEAYIAESNNHEAAWRQMLEQLILQQMEREQDILTASPTERFHRLHARSPQLFQKIPHKYIAAYLRMTPETLSRIKK